MGPFPAGRARELDIIGFDNAGRRPRLGGGVAGRTLGGFALIPEGLGA